MSYAEDYNHDIDPEFLGLCSFGSDFDIDIIRPWITKDDVSIPICEMDTRHIKNCIRLIKKSIINNKPWRTEYLEPLLEELKERQACDIIRSMSEQEYIQFVHKGRK